jgi:hypothetical protein
MSQPIGPRRSFVQSVYENEKVALTSRLGNKMMRVLKLAVTAILETFSLSSIKANITHIYSKLKGTESPTSKKVYEYTLKMFNLVKIGQLSPDQKRLIEQIEDIKAFDKKLGTELEATAIKLFSDKSLNPSSKLKTGDEKVSTYLSIAKQDLDYLKKREDTTGKALSMFLYQMEGSDLNFETLKEFKKKTLGFKDIDITIQALQTLLEKKAIELYAKDIHRAGSFFTMGDQFINTQEQDISDETARLHVSESIFQDIKDYYLSCGKTSLEASKLATTCMFASSQGGLFKTQEQVISRLSALFPEAVISLEKVKGEGQKQNTVILTPNGFTITEQRPYKFTIVSPTFHVSIPVDIKIVNFSDGKTVTADYQTIAFRPDLLLKEFEANIQSKDQVK